MPDFLSKEEIRKWRSSLERITLEEYAARLGKVIQEEKHDDSLVDSVILKSLNSMTTERYMPGTEKIRTLSLKSFNKEKEIKERKETPVQNEVKEVKEVKEKAEVKPAAEKKPAETAKTAEMKKKEAEKTKEIKETVKAVKETKTAQKKVKAEAPAVKPAAETASADGAYSFKKALTPREQLVFDHFLENRNTIVYAADLAKILDLPRDYVYKYIKNLRGKLNEDILQNAENGGYLLKV